MKNTFTQSLFGLLVFSLLLAGCAKPPQEDLETAGMALASADEAEADLYVQDLYQAARDSFALAQTEVEAQNAKNAFSRDYTRATNLLLYVAQTAAEAQAQVDSRKDEMRLDNEALIAEAELALATAEALTKQAPRGKDGTVALVAIQEDANVATASLEVAKTAQLEGDYVKANDLAQAVLDKANQLVEELNAAIAKTQPTPRS